LGRRIEIEQKTRLRKTDIGPDQGMKLTGFPIVGRVWTYGIPITL